MDWMGVDYEKYGGLTLEQIEAESRNMPEQTPESGGRPEGSSSKILGTRRHPQP